MKSKWWVILTVALLMAVIIFFVRSKTSSTLVSSSFTKTTTQEVATEVPNATPNAPKTYNFDSSTDLKQELDSINPQVLDSDFE